MINHSLIDTHKHQGLRRKLVDVIHKQGIEDEEVLQAFMNVPRHQFLDSVFDNLAYENQALPIDENQTISQPYTVAYQTEKLQLEDGDRILEIGTGSGYQAAILAQYDVEVFTIERHKKLYEKTSQLLHKMALTNIYCYYGDGFKGLPDLAPFDKIIITASPKKIPENLIQQLKVGGRMILPIDKGQIHKMTLIIKKQNDELQIEELDDFKFVPMLKGAV